MQPEKVVELIERLTAKTNSGELRWSEGVRIDTYQTSFPDYSIIIEENTSLRATDPASSFIQDKSSHRKEFSMRILDSRGDVVASILDDRSAGIMSSALGKMAVENKKLARLFAAARQSVSRAGNQAVEALLGRLG